MPDLKDILRSAGFTGSALDTAYAIAMAESGGNAKAFNGNTSTGDQSYGLFQINMLGGMGPERRAQYGLSSNDALYDAVTNAKVAYQMSKGGTDWSPWSTYKRGDYKKYLGQTGASVSGAGSSSPSGADAHAADGAFLNDTAPTPADIIGSGLGKDFAQQPTDFGVPTVDQSKSGFQSPETGVSTAPYQVGKTIPGSLRDKAIAKAMGLLGTPYVWGGATPVGLDCSGLMLVAYGSAGYSLPRVSYDQLALGKRTSVSNLQPGDFVGFRDGGHIAMYIGDGQIIESPRPGKSVQVRTLGANEAAWGVHLSLPGD